MDTLMRCKRENTKFTNYLHDICSSLHPTSRAELHSLLNLPLTRISQYEILLQNISINTSSTMIDFNNISICLSTLHNVNKEIEISAQQSANYVSNFI
jgi:hypothetical protein